MFADRVRESLSEYSCRANQQISEVEVGTELRVCVTDNTTVNIIAGNQIIGHPVAASGDGIRELAKSDERCAGVIAAVARTHIAPGAEFIIELNSPPVL
jgi:hypothetical protein